MIAYILNAIGALVIGIIMGPLFIVALLLTFLFD